MDGEELLVMPPSEGKCGDDVDSGSQKMNDGRRKRRFSDRQVRSLECIFEAQTKLEPRRMAQLAGELGLHPRQVTVWFQNRRARWKSKQLETEYDALRAEYDALLSSFESLEKEKQSLSAQLEKLAELLEKPAEEGSDRGDSGDGNSKGEETSNPSLLPLERSVDLNPLVCSDERELIGYTEHREAILCHSEPILSPLVLPQRPCGFDAAGGTPDQSIGTSSDWWELWPPNE